MLAVGHLAISENRKSKPRKSSLKHSPEGFVVGLLLKQSPSHNGAIGKGKASSRRANSRTTRHLRILDKNTSTGNPIHELRPLAFFAPRAGTCHFLGDLPAPACYTVVLPRQSRRLPQ